MSVVNARSSPRSTIRDVARLADVGIKTVSRVINDEPNVAPDTRARVERAIAALRYEPDLHAGSLRRASRRTQTIGLLVGSVANPFSGALHRAVEDAARLRSVAVFAQSLDEDPRRERDAVSAFLRRRVDGLILTVIDPSQAYLAPEQERGTPLVFVDRRPSGLNADTVVADNAGGAATATAHLLSRGHRRIAFLGDRPDIWTAGERRRGFLEELGRSGVPTGTARVVEGLEDEERSRAVLAAILAEPDPPTAVFSSQNLITIGAIRALRDQRMQHRIALVGFDDVPGADLIEPGVTVVAQSPERIGAIAAERLFDRLDGADDPARTMVVPTRLIERGSGEITAGR